METKTAATTLVGRTAAREPEPGGGRGRLRGSPALTLLTVALGVMMVSLDGTIVAVANPAIQSDLHASLAGIQWVTNAYLLALAVSLITIGKLGDRFGHKKVFLTGVAGFAASSAAIGLSGTIASSIALVIAFRALQGVFGVRETPSSPAASSFDIPGIATLSGALFLLIWGLIKGPDYGWGSARTLAFLGGAALMGLLFVIRESRARQPLLPLRLFRSVSLSAGVVLVILLMFALFGAMFFMTFYLENVHGLDPIGAGVHLLPMTAMLIIGSPVSATLISKLGPRIPIVAGMVMAAVAMFGLSGLSATSSPNDTIVWFVLLGLGLSPVMVGATDVIVGNAPVELAGVAGGLQSTAMQLGGTLGTAVLGAVMSAKITSLLPASWHAAHLPVLSTAQLAQVKSAVSVGAAPVTRNTPPQLATEITHISHATFVAGMHNAFLVAAAVALAGALIALITKRGNGAAGAHAGI